MSDTRFVSPFGEFDLYRFPLRKRELLRAWDAADEYLLQTLGEQQFEQQKLLIINDSFGALAVALHRYLPASWSDSWLAHQALQENLLRNDCDKHAVKPIPSTDIPNQAPDLVLMKLPKSLALFEHQLIQLKPLLTEKSRIVVAGMVKTMPATVWNLLEKTIGPTDTSRAKKKARLIEVSLDQKTPLPDNPFPKRWCLEGTSIEIINDANVFSRERLDLGTRLLLQHLPPTKGPVEVIDLGCGNGILGLMAARQNPEARLTFIDESYMAIRSASANFLHCGTATQLAGFHLGDGLIDFDSSAADLILCNPPFHQSHAIGDSVAMSMFKESARVLRDGGELWVVGNRHLNYHCKLKRWFSCVNIAASNKKFVILKATA